MSARIFVHPRCVHAGPANAQFVDMLAAKGFDTARTVIYTIKLPKVYELVARVARHLDDSVTYQRMDGYEFWKPADKPPTRPAPTVTPGGARVA